MASTMASTVFENHGAVGGTVEVDALLPRESSTPSRRAMTPPRLRGVHVAAGEAASTSRTSRRL
jgi:hypothetical protein